uniref:Putative secreted peptide n=1 Tax=Anopheles braziliensis TaxID=58242 RepID=A0A2M3ZWC5_9DIPT
MAGGPLFYVLFLFNRLRSNAHSRSYLWCSTAVIQPTRKPTHVPPSIVSPAGVLAAPQMVRKVDKQRQRSNQ